MKIDWRDKIFIKRSYLSGTSSYKIAEILGCSPQTISYHLHKVNINLDFRSMLDKPSWNKGIPRTDTEKLSISEATKEAMTPEICQHLSELASNRTGELANNWKGGRWTEWIYPTEFNMVKYQVRERDNYTCQECGATTNLTNDRELDVHHKDSNRFNNQLSNLTTLCRSCHKLIEANIRAEKVVMTSGRD